jgi:hypothetical protein
MNKQHECSAGWLWFLGFLLLLSHCEMQDKVKKLEQRLPALEQHAKP